MRPVILITLTLLAQNLIAQTSPPVFESYPVTKYARKLKLPKWIHRDKQFPDTWRDALDKVTQEPVINFAGRYFLATHSCGTSCSYYTLTDLSTGRDLDHIVHPFAAAEPLPRTRDGSPYRTNLFTRPGSKLLIVQFELEKKNGSECRERSYVFEDGKLRPVTGTLRMCREFEGS